MATDGVSFPLSCSNGGSDLTSISPPSLTGVSPPLSGSSPPSGGVSGLLRIPGPSEIDSRFEEDVEMQTPASHENFSSDESLKEKTAAPDALDEMQTADTYENSSPAEGLKEKALVVYEMQTPIAHEKELIDMKIGMEFETEQQAYDFYNEYARRLGFVIRKSNVHRNKENVVCHRIFCCSKEGFRKKDKRDANVKNYRPESRTGCLAHIVISLMPHGKYSIVRMETTHNHQLTPMKGFMFRSQNNISEADLADSVGIRPKTTHDLMSVEAGGAANVGYLPIDYGNYLQSKRTRLMKKGDARNVLEYLREMIASDPGSFYTMQLDEDEKISGMFWADSKMVNDYYAFGDVVCFDTTYKINNYGRPFALFFGVNHHRQIAIFGAALIYDETSESFQWVFKAFLHAMSEKEPKTILTDQDKAMASAISIALPNTYHRICVWHMYQNAAKHLNNAFQHYDSFRSDFSKCIFEFEEEVDFLEAWDMMLEKYGLRENSWLQQIFNEREKWALVYGRNTFCADMKCTQWSEGMTATLRKYLHSSHSLELFFPQFERLVADKRMAEAEADFKMTQTAPVLAYDIPILFGARKVYTPEIFELFQEEWVKGMNCIARIHCTVDTIITYHVHSMIKKRDYVVIFESLHKIVECACKKFEFSGILCGHALKVLDHAGVVEVPDRYILKRWRKDAKVSVVNISSQTSEDKRATSTRYKELLRNSIKLFSKAADTQETFVLMMKMINEAVEKLEHQDIHPTSNSTSQCIPPDDLSAESTQGKEVKRKGRPRKKNALDMSTNKSSSNEQDPISNVNQDSLMNPCVNEQDDGHDLITSQMSQATENGKGGKLSACSNIRQERMWTTGSMPSNIRMEKPWWRP